jgi:hypothetical protein
MCKVRNFLVWFVLCVLILAWPSPSSAETPAPSIHWGATGYPDRERTLMAGVTFNRFTEYDPLGNRFNDIRETSGFNFGTLSWTERWGIFNGLNTNLTVGAGPTSDQPTRTLQNGVTHKIFNLRQVPVGATREGADFMISGDVTKWLDLLGQRELGFGGIGFASGSLYHEAFADIGVRRLSLSESFGSPEGSWLRSFSDYVRFSGMARYSRLYGGSAYPVVAPQSYLGQASISISNYKNYDPTVAPRWELEITYTIDSGLFVGERGGSIEEQFISTTLRFPYGRFETWNDFIGWKDYGPTYGATLTFDLFQIFAKN